MHLFNFFSFYGVLNIELPKYKCNLTTVKPVYLAQLFSAVVLKTRLFSLSFLLQKSCSYLFSSDVVSTCGVASKQTWDCVERKECKCFPWGLVVSRFWSPGKFECNVTFASGLLLLIPLPGASHRR